MIALKKFVRLSSTLRSFSSTLADVVKRESKRLERAGVAFGQGCDNAVDEAAWLALRCLNQPIDAALDDVVVTAADSAKVSALVDERIRTRQPVCAE